MRISTMIVFCVFRMTFIIHDIFIHLANIVKKAAKDNAIHTEREFFSCIIRPIPVHFPGALQSPNEA